MDDDLDRLVLTLASREIHDVWDRVRRYCGLEWSGGGSETWAFRFYDTIDTDPDRLDPVDVVAAGALHPGLARADLAFFWEQCTALDAWIRQLPVGVSLGDADDAVLGHLDGLRNWPDAPNLGLVTKVLHRKRPELIPLVDRDVLDWYRPVTGDRSATKAWPALVRAMSNDLATNRPTLAMIAEALEAETGRHVSALRLVDIAIWMGAAR